MEHINDPTKTPEELKAIAAKVNELLSNELSPRWDTLEKPAVLAMVVAEDAYNEDLRSLLLEDVQEEYVGIKIHEMLPKYVALFDHLKQNGTGRAHAVDLGRDAYVYAIEEREVTMPKAPASDFLKELFEAHEIDFDPIDTPDVVKVKVLGVDTQSKNYIVVLNHHYAKWTFHAREVFPTLESALEKGYLGDLDKFNKGAPITIEDMVQYANRAAKYADDVPGNHYPERPSLQTFLTGNLVAGSEDAGIGLRYADGRDRAYVVSTKHMTDMNPCANDVGWGSMRAIDHVIQLLNMATDVLPSVDPAP